MTIAIYVALWLLSGFAAAWLTQRYLDERKYDYPVGAVLVMSAIGPLALFIVISVLAGKGLSISSTCLGAALKKPLFKVKEPK